MDDDSARLTQLGKGLVQINLRLARVLSAVEERSASAASRGPELDVLLDLLDAVGQALERRPGRGARRLVDRLLGRAEASAIWRGLAMAREDALERLRAVGVEAAPDAGVFDPALHRAVEVVPAPHPEQAGTLARTHRRGWVVHAGGERRVLRTAQVSVFAEGAE